MGQALFLVRPRAVLLVLFDVALPAERVDWVRLLFDADARFDELLDFFAADLRAGTGAADTGWPLRADSTLAFNAAIRSTTSPLAFGSCGATRSRPSIFALMTSSSASRY